MVGSITRPQFDALYRLFESLDRRSSISGVSFSTSKWSDTPGGALNNELLRVEFLSGHGNRGFHIDREGNSAPIENGTSELHTYRAP
jgi:hypothetical protein